MSEKKDFPQVEPQLSDVEPAKADNPKQPSADKHLHKIVEKLGELTNSIANRLKEMEANVKAWRGDQISGFEKVFKEFEQIQGRLDAQQGIIDTFDGLDPKIADLQKQIRALGDITNNQNETLAKALRLAEMANDRLDSESEDGLFVPALLNVNAPAELPSDLQPMTLDDARKWLLDNYKRGQRAVLFLGTDLQF